MKFKKSRRLTAVIASILLAFSAASAVTGTVAWFTASNVVSVAGPSIQAEAEQGIVIANETHTADSHWAQTVSVSHNGTSDSKQAKFIPTSTADGVSWYHAVAENVDHQKAGSNGVSSITAAVNADGLGVCDINNTPTVPTDDKNVYLLNKVYLQASTPAAITEQDLFIKEVNVEGVTQALSKSLRVLFKVSANYGSATAATCIYAPAATGDTVVHDYNGTGTLVDGHGGLINGTTALTAYKVAASGTNDELLDNCTIPAYTTNGTSAIEISIYVYFEGEDFNCKSSNIETELEALSLSFKFENKAHA